MTIIYIILGLLLLTIIPGAVSVWFYDFRYRRHLLKEANKTILEAQSWKKDVEYFLEVIKKKGNITFAFEGSRITYNYQQMDCLLKRVVTYLQNYDEYVEYVKLNQWHNLLPPHFHQEYNSKADGVDAWISNYAEVVEEEKEIKFLRFLHSIKKT